MLEKLIRFFAERHMLVNFITIAIIFGAIFAYQNTGREEMPNYELNFISIRTVYPGATPEDVEQLVTKRLERQLKGIDGVYMMRSTSTSGSSQITVEFVPGYADMDRALNDIRNQIADVRLPSEVRNQPTVRQFRTTRRSVMDVAVYLTETALLTREDRAVLQQYAYNLYDQIGHLPQVSEVSSSGYYKNELQIVLDPVKLRQFNVSTSEVIGALRRNNLRVPAGNLEDENRAEVSVVAELDTVEHLHTVIIRSSFDSPAVRLSDLATIRRGFSRITWIHKVNGREAVVLNVRKTAASDIIETTDAVRTFVERYQKDVLADAPVEIQIIADASRDVRNRLHIIMSNGILGIGLLLIFLFLFMDARSAFWVAMGIPFTFCITAIAFPIIGYTINNTTLAAIIIVMGLIVDDAIVVAENVARHRASGKSPREAVVIGTREVFLPILAAITTTCAAFLPLLFFSGRHGQMLVFIPPVVIIVLVASLLETLFILPTHLGMHLPNFLKHPLQWIKTVGKARRERYRHSYNRIAPVQKKEKQHWFMNVEKAYARLLYRVLPYRAAVMVFGACLLLLAAYIFSTQLRFVLFPDEESNEIIVHGSVRQDAAMTDAEYIVRGIEAIIEQERPFTINSYRTFIGRNRRGRTTDQTAFSITIEMNHRDDREKTSSELVRHWRQILPELPNIHQVQVATSRFGSSSGSVIEVEVRENDDTIRLIAAEMVRDALRALPRLANAEVDEPVRNPEYRINLNRELITRLSINPSEVAAALRTVLEGTIVAELNSGDEEVDLRVTVDENYKGSVYSMLQNFVENTGNYLVPIAQLVSFERVLTPAAITRILQRRTTMVYASPEDENAPAPIRRGRPGQTNTEAQSATMLSAAEEERIMAARLAFAAAPPEKEMTPIEVAEYLEDKVFPEIQKIYPSVVFGFSGEIKDTRESSSDIFNAVLFVLFFMFVILSLIFGSFVRPLVIMLTIPFSMVGVVLAFWMHGIEFFGLFATIGAIGLAGVIINDSILMVDKLDRSVPPEAKGKERRQLIAEGAATRLCAITLTTLTTVCAIMPTAYGFFGYDSMLTQMMLAISWGLLFGTIINLLLIPCVYTFLGPSPKKSAGYVPKWENEGQAASPEPSNSNGYGDTDNENTLPQPKPRAIRKTQGVRTAPASPEKKPRSTSRSAGQRNKNEK